MKTGQVTVLSDRGQSKAGHAFTLVSETSTYTTAGVHETQIVVEVVTHT